MKASGLNGKWSPNSILGITDTETVMLDFDKTPFRKVKDWAHRTMKRFELQGFIILKSSENSYHVVFDRKVSWSENVSVIDWVSLMLFEKYKNITKWSLLQGIKKGSTLRVSPKKDKPCPRVVLRYGKQENQIKAFLSSRKQIKNMMRKLIMETMSVDTK